MGLLEFHVDRIDVQTVPKFVLFGGSDRDESTADAASVETASNRPLPVSAGQVVAVAIVATILAVAVAKVVGVVDSKLNLHC